MVSFPLQWNVSGYSLFEKSLKSSHAILIALSHDLVRTDGIDAPVRSETMLVVEDEGVKRWFLAPLLEQQGY